MRNHAFETSDSEWWDWEPFFRDRSCNIVFTPEDLIAFLKQQSEDTGKDPKCAAKELGDYTTRINKAAFDSGSLILEEAPAYSCFNLSGLPNELITCIFEAGFASPYIKLRTLKAMSLTSKRFRALVAPFIFSRLTIDNRLFRRHQLSLNVVDGLKEIPLSRLRHVNFVSFNQTCWLDVGGPSGRDEPPRKTEQLQILEAMRDFLSRVYQERQRRHLFLNTVLLGFYQRSSSWKKIPYLSARMGRVLGEFLSTLPGLNSLLLCGDMSFQSFSRRFSTGASNTDLKALGLNVKNFTNVLENFPMASLKYLIIPTMVTFPSPTCLHSNLRTLLIATKISYPCYDAYRPSTDYTWDLAQLHTFLSICAENLEILHIQDQYISVEKYLGSVTAHQGRTADRDESDDRGIPFRRLVILKLERVRSRWVHGEEQSQEYPGKVLADLFSLAPIRHLYCDVIEGLEKPSQNPDIASHSHTFWDGIVDYRLKEEPRSGWKDLEFVCHREPYFDSNNKRADELRSDGVTIRTEHDWPDIKLWDSIA